MTSWKHFNGANRKGFVFRKVFDRVVVALQTQTLWRFQLLLLEQMLVKRDVEIHRATVSFHSASPIFQTTLTRKTVVHYSYAVRTLYHLILQTTHPACSLSWMSTGSSKCWNHMLRPGSSAGRSFCDSPTLPPLLPVHQLSCASEQLGYGNSFTFSIQR